jgi:hypothetical protein
MQLRIKLGVITSALALAVGVGMASAVPASAAGATSTAASSTTASTSNKISNNNILDYATCQASGNCNIKHDKCLSIKEGKKDAEHEDQYWGDSLSPCSVIYCNVFVNYANSNDVLSVKKASTINGAEIVIDPYSVLIGPAADQMWL